MVGGSYGWCAPSEDPEVCLDLIARAIANCGYTDQCAFALDCASSEMYEAGKGYYLNGRHLTAADPLAPEPKTSSPPSTSQQGTKRALKGR